MHYLTSWAMPRLLQCNPSTQNQINNTKLHSNEPAADLFWHLKSRCLKCGISGIEICLAERKLDECIDIKNWIS